MTDETTDTSLDATTPDSMLALTTKIVAAYISKNAMPGAQLPALIDQVFQSLASVATGSTATPEARPDPAVPVKKSVFPDYIVCLEDGKKLKMLKRHLMTLLWHDAGRLPRALGPAVQLPDGGAQLCRAALRPGQVHRARAQARWRSGGRVGRGGISHTRGRGGTGDADPQVARPQAGQGRRSRRSSTAAPRPALPCPPPARLPWEIHPALGEDRLRVCARLLAHARRDAIRMASYEMGDTTWSVGCRAYAFGQQRMRRVAERRTYNWLSVLDQSHHFVFLVEDVPVRFFRGPADEPTARTLRRQQNEARQLDLALGEDLAHGLVFRLALEAGAGGGVDRVVFLALRGEEGHVECFWPVPIDEEPGQARATGAGQMQMLTGTGT